MLRQTSDWILKKYWALGSSTGSKWCGFADIAGEILQWTELDWLLKQMVPHIVGLLMSHLSSWLLLTRQSSFRYNILFPIPKREWDSASATSISITSSIESNFPNWAVASKLQQPSKEESLATLPAWFPNQAKSKGPSISLRLCNYRIFQEYIKYVLSPLK